MFQLFNILNHESIISMGYMLCFIYIFKSQFGANQSEEWFTLRGKLVFLVCLKIDFCYCAVEFMIIKNRC